MQASTTAVTEAAPVPASATNGAPPRAAKKRMLIIVNPYATTVSDRLKNLVVYALQGRYEVEAVTTEAQNHATEIGREAVDGGYDVVVAFGGDGTLNEVANGLAGTGVPVSVLPGGSTNVFCRTLGIPNDVVDATEHLLGLADSFHPRPVDLGLANGRRFVFACGAGLDAMVVKRVDAHPKLKARAGEWYYTWAAITGFNRQYLLSDPARMRLRSERGEVEGITTVAQNSDPFTYFGERAGPRLRGRRARQRHALGGDAEAGRPARHADGDVRGASPTPTGSRRGATVRSSTSTACARPGSTRSRRTRTARPAPSRSRSTATTSATTPRSSWASTPAP